MKRPTMILLGMALLLAVGMGLSVYANQLILESITVQQGSVGRGAPMELSSDIPPGTGVFGVQLMGEGEGARLEARVLGPLGSLAESATIDAGSYQNTFNVDERYEYSLVLESDSPEPVEIVGFIGPTPDPSQDMLTFASLYMLLIGVVGMVASTAYAIISRIRSRRSSVDPYGSGGGGNYV